MSVTEEELINSAVAPRVTDEAVEANILSEHTFTAYEGVLGEQFNHNKGEGPEGDFDPHPSLKLLTICILVTRNRFTFLGQSACASPENYNKEIGDRLARADAKNKIWSHMGYELRTQLYMQASAPGQGAEGDRQPEGHDAVGTGPAQAALTDDLEHIAVEHKEAGAELGDVAGSTSDPFASEEDN